MSLSNDIPVVVCQGSGGIADIILGALRMASGKHELVDYQKCAIIKCIRGLINSPTNEKHLFSPDYIDAATHMHNITICIEKRRLITVYRLDKPMIGAKLDQCILKALLTGRAAEQYDPVALGLKWGKCEKIIQNLLISEGISHLPWFQSYQLWETFNFGNMKQSTSNYLSQTSNSTTLRKSTSCSLKIRRISKR